MQIKNKLIAVLLTMALLVSVFVLPVFQTTATDEVTLDVWDGTQVEPQKEGGVFAIYTPEELAWYVAHNGRDSNFVGVSAKLMNDIWLNDMIVTVKDGAATATKATDTSVVIDLADHENNGLNQWFVDRGEGWFVGRTFDGQNHVVHGFYVKENYAETGGKPTAFAIGLIPRLGAATTVKNLGIENSYIDSTIGRIAAFIVGEANSAPAYISNCYTGASTFHKNTDKAAAISGGGSAASVITD